MRYLQYIMMSLTGMLITISLSGQGLWVGAAETTIHPMRDSLYFAGAEKNRKFIDVEDGLYVKAVVISGEKQEMAILTFDCIGLMYPELVKIRSRVKSMLPSFPVEHIVSSSTHTHTGPDVVGLWGKDYLTTGINQTYMDTLIEKSARTLVSAYNQKTPVSIDLATGQHGEDWVRNISEPDVIDRTLSVIRFRDTLQRNIATLTNFACHPTILIGVTQGGSADYVAGYYAYMDSVQGGVNLFLQGAIGGWVQPEDVPRKYENAIKYGRLLGREASALICQGTKSSRSNLLFLSEKTTLPMRNPNFKLMADAGVIKRTFTETVETEIACFRIGDAVFATHPGETSPALSLTTRSLMQNNGPRFILGLGMDALGYILKPSYFVPKNLIPHSPYLTSMSIGPDTYPEVEKTLAKLLSACK
jgi:hypothetical protein